MSLRAAPGRGASLPCRPVARRMHGFTLLEVLIALAILAVALAAASRAASVSIDGSVALRQRLLAEWVAQNRLSELASLPGVFPSAGTSEGDENQAGSAYRWRQTVTDTPNPNFRRIEIQVFAAQDQSYALARLIGYASQ